MVKREMEYSEPAYYSISVAGEIPPDVKQILSNFYSGDLVCEKCNKITCMKGLLKDQISLSGLLNYLTELHYILLSVEAYKKTNDNVISDK